MASLTKTITQENVITEKNIIPLYYKQYIDDLFIRGCDIMSILQKIGEGNDFTPTQREKNIVRREIYSNVYPIHGFIWDNGKYFKIEICVVDIYVDNIYKQHILCSGEWNISSNYLELDIKYNINNQVVNDMVRSFFRIPPSIYIR